MDRGNCHTPRRRTLVSVADGSISVCSALKPSILSGARVGPVIDVITAPSLPGQIAQARLPKQRKRRGSPSRRNEPSPSAACGREVVYIFNKMRKLKFDPDSVLAL